MIVLHKDILFDCDNVSVEFKYVYGVKADGLDNCIEMQGKRWKKSRFLSLKRWI